MQKSLVQLLKISLKSSFLFCLLLLVGCGPSGLDEVISQADSLDKQFGIDEADYSDGFFYFETNVRDVPLNPVDFDAIIGEYERLLIVQDDLEAQNYMQHRIELLKMEKRYKLGSRRAFASFDGVIRCSKKDDIKLSIDDGQEVINHAHEAMNLYDDSWNLYGEDWRDIMQEDIDELQSMIDGREWVIEEQCPDPINETE